MLNELYLTGILRTMREEAAAAESREEDINPAALTQFARMIEEAIYKGSPAMTNSKQTAINDYTQQLEQLTLAGEDLLKLESLFKAVTTMLDKDGFDLAKDAERLASIGHELAKQKAEYFFDEADGLEATIGQLEDEERGV